MNIVYVKLLTKYYSLQQLSIPIIIFIIIILLLSLAIHAFTSELTAFVNSILISTALLNTDINMFAVGIPFTSGPTSKRTKH